jgi:two-component system, chemotaxis family, chemotaxis protein CheY
VKTLVVEDDFTSRLLLQEILKAYGAVHIAVNGREAVEAVRVAMAAGTPYDLICLDIMMPEMDGQTALRQIRGLEEAKGIFSTDGAKIIMTTALGDLKTFSAAFKELCDAYLVKPIDKGKLLEHLRSFALIR